MKKGEEVTFCLHSQKMVAKKSLKKKNFFCSTHEAKT